MKSTVYWTEGPWRGRLAIVPRPRGGDWLDDEMQSLRDAGLDVIVSTLEPEEADDLNLTAEAEACQKQQMEFISFAIEDRQVPTSIRNAAEMVHRLEAKLLEGKNIGIHCRQGVGRSALLAACVLVAGGVAAAPAFERLTKARGCAVPETLEQREWVGRFARVAIPTMTP